MTRNTPDNGTPIGQRVSDEGQVRAGEGPMTRETPDAAGAGMTEDALLAGLAGLAVDAPEGLLDRVAARWVRVHGPLGEVSVAFTDQGIAYVHEGAEGFAEAFRKRFGRPLLAPSRAARSDRTRGSPPAQAGPVRSAPSAPPWPATRCPCSSPATG